MPYLISRRYSPLFVKVLALFVLTTHISAEPSKPNIANQFILPLHAATALVEHCIHRQQSNQSSPVAIAVVDAGGHLLSFQRMDGVTVGSTKTAVEKAKSAAYYGFTTEQMASWAKGNTSVNNLPGFLGVRGGVPIYYKNQLVGAVGVSGAQSSVDESCAKEAIQHLQFKTSKVF